MINENVSDSRAEIIETLLSCSDVARILKISRSMAYMLVQSGEIPSVHINTTVRVQPSELKAFIAKNASKSLSMS